MPNNINKTKSLISTDNYLRQVRIELEHEVLSELKTRRTRDLRREVRRLVMEAINGKFKDSITLNLDNVKSEIKDAMLPIVVEMREQAEERKRETMFKRFNLSTRLQHGIMAISVLILIFTGLPLKFPDVPLFVWFMNLMGGIDNSTYAHRIGACGLIAVSFWHLLYIIFWKEGRRDFFLMIPNLADVKNFLQMMRFYFGKSGRKPRFGRFSYVEKFDYWAVYWGCVIMIGTGILLWSPELTFSQFPKYFYDIAKEIHSDEALLATLAIVVWHFYNVHFNPSVFPGSAMMFHGKIAEHEFKEEHPLEYEEIMAKRAAEANKTSGGEQ